jgi:hypothetical protein
MKRKKTEETPAKFWPVPGVDGEPYPPLVQEALDLVAKETKRLKIRECEHKGRYPSQVNPGWEGLHSRPYHVCACRDCGADRIACLPAEECDYSRRRTPSYGFPYERREDRHVSRQLRRLQEETTRLQPYARGTLVTSGEVFLVRNALGEPVVMVPAENRAPDLSWVRTMQGRKNL